MNLKKEASEALKALPELTKSFAPEQKKKALAKINTVQRFVGELRQEKATLKQRTEVAEAASEPLREQVDKLTSQLTNTSHELEVTKQRLKSAQAALARERSVTARDTPQERLAHLIAGPDQPSADTPEERQLDRQKRRKQLHNLLPELLPDFNGHVLSEVDVIYLHQDAFAAGYHADEYTMLGMAIKFAGDHGKVVNFHGLSGETCGEEWDEEVEQLREQSETS